MTFGKMLVQLVAQGVRASVILAAAIGVGVWDLHQRRKQEELAVARWADDGGPLHPWEP